MKSWETILVFVKENLEAKELPVDLLATFKSLSIGDQEYVIFKIAALGNASILKILMANAPGFSVDSTDSQGTHVLMFAMPSQNWEMIQFLVSKDADVVKANRYQETPLSLAMKTRNEAILNLIFSKCIEKGYLEHEGASLLIYAAYLKLKDSVEALVKKGVNVNAIDAGGHTSLHYLCQSEANEEEYKRNEAIMNILLAAKAKVNVVDSEGFTPLHIAAKNGVSLSLIKVLLNAGADINKQDKNLDTALIHAVRHRHREIAKCLIEANADFNLKNKKKRSCLNLLASQKDQDLLDLLVTKGADQKEIAEIQAALPPPVPSFTYYSDEEIKRIQVYSEEACKCCKKHQGVYIPCPKEDWDNDFLICPWCIADGSCVKKYGKKILHKNFGDENEQRKKIKDAKALEELEKRTPPQREGYLEMPWMIHCGLPCKLLGTIGSYENSNGDAVLNPTDAYGIKYMTIHDFQIDPKEVKVLDNLDNESDIPLLEAIQGSPGFLYQCLKCKEYRIYTDCD